MIQALKKTYRILNNKERKKLLIIIFLLLIGMCLEVMSLGSIIPALSSILDISFFNKIKTMSFFYEILGGINYYDFIYLSLFFIVLIFLIKTFFLVYLTFKQNYFLSFLTANLSNKLLRKYLKSEYLFHLNNNSSSLIKNLQIEIKHFGTYCQSLIMLITEISLAIAVITTLIYFESTSAFIIGLFIVSFSYIYARINHEKITELGDKRNFLDTESSKIVLESLGGIKDIKILNKESFFIKIFNLNQIKRAIVYAKYLSINQISRHFLEVISILSLVGFLVIKITFQNTNAEIFSSLGLFVAATFRLLPSINRIITSYQNLNYYKSSLDIIYRDNNLIKPTNGTSGFIKKIVFKNKIELDNINFYYPGERKFNLENFNFNIKKGEIIGLIGKSGSGKSTFIDLFIGLLNPDKGEIKCDDINVRKNLYAWKSNIGYVPQHIFLTDNSIINNIALGVENKLIDINLVNKSLKSAQLDNFVKTIPDGYNTLVGERGVQLSGGQRQRIGIARALYNDPDILIFDEATSSLDKETEISIMKSINNFKRKKTVIIVTHNVNNLKNCDRIYSIAKGNLKQVKFKDLDQTK